MAMELLELITQHGGIAKIPIETLNGLGFTRQEINTGKGITHRLAKLEKVEQEKVEQEKKETLFSDNDYGELENQVALVNLSKVDLPPNQIMIYANTLEEFFRSLVMDKSLHPIELANELSEKSSINELQLQHFNHVALRTLRARGIVKYLENHYGINDELRFNKPRDLHKNLLKNQYVPKHLTAKSYNIAIGFRKEY